MSDAITAETVRTALRQVIDPEIGVNIVDLGLIYQVLLSEDNTAMKVSMTMTSPTCPLGALLSQEVRQTLSRRWPTLQQIEVELVWDPPWSTDSLSEEAKRQLGWDSQ